MEICTIDLYFCCIRPGELDVTNSQSKENRPKAERIKELSILFQHLQPLDQIQNMLFLLLSKGQWRY